MQRALRVLKESDALETRSKGHMGRVITHIDTGLCWNIAKLPAVQLLMPSSGSIEIDVLVEHVTGKLGAMNIPYFISNATGGERRIAQVLKGDFDIALTSMGAARNMVETIPDACLRTMPPETYYSSRRLIVVSRSGEARDDWKTIAIDRNSSDHNDITEAEFPSSEGYSHVETDFRQVPSRILRREVDAGLWHLTSSPVPLELAGLRASMLQRETAVEIHRNLSAAAFVVNPERPELVSLLAELDDTLVMQAQLTAFHQEDPYLKAFETIG